MTSLTAQAEQESGVFVIKDEFSGFYDSGGVYNVAGVVRNLENNPVAPYIIINVNDGGKIISQSILLPIVNPSKDIPFKTKFAQVHDKNPILEEPEVSYTISNHPSVDIQIIYDKTLVKHPDGHTSGFMINNDTVPAYEVKVYAAIYGKDGKFHDVGQSIENITKMDPGQKVGFNMYPDPSISSEISFYSCFAVGADPLQYGKVQGDFGVFNFTYLSLGYVDAIKVSGPDSLVMTARNPFPVKEFINFMLPMKSGSEKFTVLLNGHAVDVLQSKDPEGYWHVAFDLPARSTRDLTISGFDFNATGATTISHNIPNWVKNSAKWWHDGSIGDSEFVKGIQYLLQNGVMQIPQPYSGAITSKPIPSWIKNNAGWWADGQMSDDEFIKSIQWLVTNGIIQV